MPKQRLLSDLVSVGPCLLRDFELLGVRSVRALARRNARALYEQLCRATGQAQDPCVLDVLTAAVEQARNPRLPAAKRQWWYWSRRRKAAELRSARGAWSARGPGRARAGA